LIKKLTSQSLFFSCILWPSLKGRGHPKKFYKTDTYKTYFDGVKSEIVSTIGEAQKLKGKFTEKVLARALKNVSEDMAKMTLKMNNFENKGIGYVEAAATFENVARTALIAVSTTFGGGPAGAALANVIADKYISKKKLTAESALKSMAVGMAAGYAADKINLLLLQSGHSARLAHMAGEVSRNVVGDGVNVVVNHSSYNAADFISSVLRGLANSQLQIGDHGTIDEKVLTDVLNGALNGASSNGIQSLVHENKVNIDHMADAGLASMGNSLVTSSVTHSIEDNVPDEVRAKWNLNQKVGEILADFKEALVELIDGLKESKLMNEEFADMSGLSKDQKVILSKFVKEQDAKARDEVAKKMGYASYEDIPEDKLDSKEYQEGLKCERQRLYADCNGKPDVEAIYKKLNEQVTGDGSGRSPAGFFDWLLAGKKFSDTLDTAEEIGRHYRAVDDKLGSMKITDKNYQKYDEARKKIRKLGIQYTTEVVVPSGSGVVEEYLKLGIPDISELILPEQIVVLKKYGYENYEKIKTFYENNKGIKTKDEFYEAIMYDILEEHGLGNIDLK
jgi:hypothetical protein